jgi:hypothetical protein
MNLDSEDLVTLMSTNDPLEAEILLAKLRSACIPAYIRHDAVSNVIGITFDGVGRQDVMVRAEDLVEAKAALDREPGCQTDS